MSEKFHFEVYGGGARYATFGDRRTALDYAESEYIDLIPSHVKFYWDDFFWAVVEEDHLYLLIYKNQSTGVEVRRVDHERF